MECLGILTKMAVAVHAKCGASASISKDPRVKQWLQLTIVYEIIRPLIQEPLLP